MLIPSIDLKDGAVVQLVQGERLAIKDEDVFRWVRRFERFPKVQVIDLDAAMDSGDDLAFAQRLSEAVGRERVIAAVDSRNGHVVIHGWKTALPITASEAVRALEP